MLISVFAFFEPRGTLAVQDMSDVLHLTVFAGVSVIVCLLSHRLEQALAHALSFERHLERSNQRLDLAQECVDAGVWEWDIDHDRGYWSPGFRLLIGVTDDAPVSLAGFLDRLHPSDRGRVQQDVQRAIDEGEFRSEFRVLHPTRGEIWLLSAGRTLRNESGRPVRLTGIVVDITERKRNEQELRESREQFRAIADTMPHFVWSGRPDGYIDYYNQRWYEYTGMPRTPDQGWNWKLYIHSDDLARTVAAWERSLAIGEPFDVEYRVRRGSDGSYRWFMGRALPIRADRGEITRWFGTCTDVDEQRRLAEARDAILSAERAARTHVEHAMRERDEFVATLAHELRTPLNAILGWTQMLRRPASPDVLARGLEVIERNTRAQAQVISDLLDIGYVTSGKIRLAREVVNLLSIVRAAVSVVRPAAEAKGVRIDATAEPARGRDGRRRPPAADRVEPAQQRREVHARRRGDRRRRAARRRHGGAAGDGFGRGHRRRSSCPSCSIASGRPTRAPRGRTADWALACRSRSTSSSCTAAPSKPSAGGSGAARRSSCGCRQRERRIPPAPRPAATSRSRAHTCWWWKTRPMDGSWSRESSRRVAAASRQPVSAADAIESFTQETPDLVISDIGMPGMDGFELLTRLRALEAGRRVPAIALTTFARAEDRTRSLLAGYQGHVPKPVDPAELLATVASLLQLSERSETGIRTETAGTCHPGRRTPDERGRITSDGEGRMQNAPERD